MLTSLKITFLALATATLTEGNDSLRSFKSHPATRKDGEVINRRAQLGPSIVGGEEIEKGSRPYLVSLGKNGTHDCGGSLLTPNVVLTAAHCTETSPDYVDFNRHNLNDDAGVVRMYLEDGSVVNHPNYDSITFENDVSLLFLPSPMTGIMPVKLNDRSRVPTNGQLLDVAGWGRLEEDSDYPDVPMAVTLKYITNEDCIQPPFNLPEDMILPVMLCAFDEGKDSCQGDSGKLNCKLIVGAFLQYNE